MKHLICILSVLSARMQKQSSTERFKSVHDHLFCTHLNFTSKLHRHIVGSFNCLCIRSPPFSSIPPVSLSCFFIYFFCIFSHPFLPSLRLLVLFLLGFFQLGDFRGKLCQLSGLCNHAHKWKES